MEILKFVLMGLAIFIGLVLIIPLFTKKSISVKRDIVIEKPKPEVFDFVRLLKNQDHFSVWANKDPEMKKEFRGKDGTVGSVSAWDSQLKDLGMGEQEILKIVDGERIDYELRFYKPFKATNYADFTFETISESETKVSWGFSGRMSYPMNLFLLIRDIEGMMGNDLYQGLVRLKAVLEK